MSVEALPLTLLILLGELTIGGIWVLVAADLRGSVAKSFIKFGTALVATTAFFTFLVAANTAVAEEIDGYPLAAGFMPAVRISLAVLFALTIPYSLAAIMGARKASIAFGSLAGAAGLSTIILMSLVFAPPTWGYPGILLSLILGALVLGAVSIGMVLGHWYLVKPKLPEKPLRDLTFVLIVALILQALLLVPSLALPRESLVNSFDTPIGESPFFWMRVAGLGLPLAFTYMAYDSSGVRAMQSATGLLYVSMALVIAGEVLAKGLLFVTAVPS